MTMDDSATPTVAAGEVTRLLDRWSKGDPAALEELLPLVYGELKAIAERVFRRERPGHTLQPTALLNEAFLKLGGGPAAGYRDRAHYYAVASQAMRQILVDHARARDAAKRGGGVSRLELDEERAGAGSGATIVEVLAVDAALNRLSAVDSSLARMVELRFFGGLTIEEVAQVLEISTPTVKRDWRLAKAFLARELA
ncbi:MAG: sigma-70 family RNA polymerase sigma factor [Thermoanaerobaculia bacterium]